MRKQDDVNDNGSWPLAEELLERGDPHFVREVRRLTDADRLGDLAPRWYGDRRPQVRRLLFDYLDLPLNAFRHEALVKRLFKLAERAGDDEVMARFLVLFDRSVRRVRRTAFRVRVELCQSLDEANALADRRRAEGFQAQAVERAGAWRAGGWKTGPGVYTQWQEESLAVPWKTTMWRPGQPQRQPDAPFGTPVERLRGKVQHGPFPIDEGLRRRSEARRLFSVPTRQYLRRRAWRYFRTLGKKHPERYVRAVAAALKLYRDEDTHDGLALLDNWGLMHVLFHHSPVPRTTARHWKPVPGRSLRELEPAPLHAELWRQEPAVYLELVREARCRAVRQWAIFLLCRDHEDLLNTLPVPELVRWLGHDDPGMVELAAQLLRRLPDLAALGVDRLLDQLERSSAETIEVLCALLAERLRPEAVALEQAVRLAVSRPLPAARLGLRWLQGRTPGSAAECRALLALVDAEAEPVRPEAVSWLRGVLAAAADFQPEWVLDFLDSKYADVRAAGWRWLEEDDRIAGDVGVWQKLLESPYDDVRLHLVKKLGQQAARKGLDAEAGRLDGELLRFLWASVLLNVQRGGRSKPVVVGQVVRRLGRRPDEAAVLLPLVGVALRSLRGPEWRAGLAAVVQAVERSPELRPLMTEQFPELKMGV